MKDKHSRSKSFTRLRKRAEQVFQENNAKIPTSPCHDIERVVHELQVHQIELKLQNEELRRIQVELEDSRQKYIELYDFAPVGYYTFDEMGYITHVNLAGAALVGIERRELIGRRFSAFLDDESQRRFYLHCRGVLESGSQQLCELRLMKKDGAQVNIFMKSGRRSSLIDQSPEIRSAVTDITEKITANEVLHKSEEKYRLLFTEMISSAILFEAITDAKGQMVDALYLDVNPAFERFTGLDRSQIIGKRLLEIYPKTEKSWFEGLSTVVRTGQSVQMENYHQHFGRYFAITAFQPRPGQVAITFSDITDQKRAEAEIQSVARFPEENPNPVMRISAAGELLYANAAAKELLASMGWEKDKPLPGALLEPVQGAAEDGANLEFALPSPTGKVYSFSLSDSTKTDYINLYGRDITEKVKADLALRKAHEELESRVEERTADLVEANRHLLAQIEKRKMAENSLRDKAKELETQSASLAEVNAALRVLLKQRDQDRRELEEKVLVNVNDLVRPHLSKLMCKNLGRKEKSLLGVIESNLEDIVSPLARKLTIELARLSPAETQVASLIRQGKTTKEIAELMGLATSTIDFHRHNIRKKLRLSHKGINLTTYLTAIA